MTRTRANRPFIQIGDPTDSIGKRVVTGVIGLIVLAAIASALFLSLAPMMAHDARCFDHLANGDKREAQVAAAAERCDVQPGIKKGDVTQP